MPLSVHIVTAEREVYAEDGVDEIVVPGSEGELTVLPHHAPLLTMIHPGIMRIVKGNEETVSTITGGFLEVRENRVTILADAAERVEEIDVSRAEEARLRAQRALDERIGREELAAAAAALQRALLRLRAAERRHRRTAGVRPPPGTTPPGS
ncbi:MAG TPA: F0F1 ATP synthase subunit epsilon [Dehalococcoidia bacterium]|jgi:F-type H+-transporting ATPase subunit epsilon|nr:F0F1 ATP synthase subunit epsilon [Dehalococcoidia bacterium]